MRRDTAGVVLLGRWFGPLSENATWRAAALLLVAVPASLAWFVMVVIALGVGLALAATVLGLPLAAGCLVLATAPARVERARVGMVAVPVPARALQRPGPWFRPRLLLDGTRWRAVGYLALLPVTAAVALAFALAAWGVALYAISLPLWGWAVGLPLPTALLLAAVGVALLGVGPRATVVAADASVRVTRAFLGPDPADALRARVDTLTDQRDEILQAVAGERRRIERNLHDGVQQGLVALGIDMDLAADLVERDPEAARALISGAKERVRESIGELRALGRGLHPAILEDRGLDAALSAVVSAAPIPVTLRGEAGPLDRDTAEVAYFVVSEAVGNVLKHARARAAAVVISRQGRCLQVRVDDDGVGGADPAAGTGLAGIAARVHAHDGRLTVTSPPGGPTSVVAELPVRDDG